MQSVFIVVLFLCHVWSTSALPCDIWSPGETNNVLLSHPAEEEIILLTFSEDDGEGGDDGGEKPYQISTDVSDDDRLSGEVVDSAASKGLSANAKSDPLPLNDMEEVSQQTHSSVDVNNDEDVGLTTESVKV